MKRISFVLAALFVALLAAVGSNAAVTDRQTVAVRQVTDTPSGVTVTIEFPEATLHPTPAENGMSNVRVDVAGAQPEETDGGVILPVVTRLIEVPDGYKATARVVNSSAFSYDVDAVVPRDWLVRQGHRIGKPASPVFVGKPGWLRYKRVAPVVIRPAEYRADQNSITSARTMEIEFTFVPDGSPSRDAVDPARYWSPDFETYFNTYLLNPSRDGGGEIAGGGKLVERGSYVIITDPRVQNYLTTFVEWKQRKGFNVVVKTFSMYGENKASADQIKQYILDAYNNWDRPPEYILLIGDVNASSIQLPSYYAANPDNKQEQKVTDLPYVLLNGDDYFPDAFIGRMSVDLSPLQINSELGRTIYHDRTPNVSEPGWYKRATLFAGNYGEGNLPVVSPVENCRWLADLMRTDGWDVEEFYYIRQGDNIQSEPIWRSINRGVSVVAYRGWADAHGTHYPQFYETDIDHLEWYKNGMLPVFTFFVCNTGDFGNPNVQPSFGEYSMQAGTLAKRTGSVAFFGPSDLHTKTQYNNPLLAGYYSALLDQGIHNISLLTLNGKMTLWSGFPNDAPLLENNQVSFYFHVYNTQGDPDLTVYGWAPNGMLVDFPKEIKLGTTGIDVHVRSAGGVPIKGAMVNVMRASDGRNSSVLTDATGYAAVPLAADSTEPLKITVLSDERVPFTDTISVSAEKAPIVFASAVVTDSPAGLPINSDALLTVSITNNTETRMTGVTGSLQVVNGINLNTFSASFGDIEPGATAASNPPFFIRADYKFARTETLPFELAVSYGADPDTVSFRLPVLAPDLEVTGLTFGDSERMYPGDDKDLVLEMTNNGTLTAQGLLAGIYSDDEAVQITDYIGGFGDVPVGGSSACTDNKMHLKIAPIAHEGRQVRFYLKCLDGNGNILEWVPFTVILGSPDPTDPIGPDGYGYYAYEDIDTTIADRPLYNWIELDPDAGGNGELHATLDDTTFFMPLPFTFTFYGEEFDKITVSDNGWLAMGETWMEDFRNWDIPSPQGPPYLIAPFWEDLVVLDESNNKLPLKIFTRYDQAESRLIVEWSKAQARTGAGTAEETFEVILYDPTVAKTKTGDGVIEFQYKTIQLVDRSEKNYATVGIEDGLHERGLQISYSNRYSLGAGELVTGRAIKFTTTSPDTLVGVFDKGTAAPLAFELAEPYPNPFNASTTINYSLARTGTIKLALYDLSGRLVRTLADGNAAAGRYSITLNATDISSGMYIVRLDQGSLMSQKKMILLK